MRPFHVTWAAYRDRCRPTPSPLDAHRRRQLAELINAYGVTDHRPATAVELEHPPAELDGHPIPGEVLL